MTTDPMTLFWNEIYLIQKRHALFFPVEQIEFISLKDIENGLELVFSEQYDLSSIITLEIEFAFKMITK